MTKVGEFNPLSVRSLNRYLYGVCSRFLSKRHKKCLLLKYVSIGNIERVKSLLLDPTIDISMMNNYPLRMAVNNLDINMVSFLLSFPSVDPSVDNGILIFNVISDTAIVAKRDNDRVSHILKLLLNNDKVNIEKYEGVLLRFIGDHYDRDLINMIAKKMNVSVRELYTLVKMHTSGYYM